ncbi:hypothetical protein YB2330_001855 [Saitoella coloradoensis]
MPAEGNNRIILGMMTFGPEGTSGARVYTVEETNTALEKFKSLGYDELDTARAYCEGKQESYTRDCQYKEKGFKVATKVYPVNAGDHSPEKLRATFETSLKELGTDKVDILYLHAPDWSTPLSHTLEEINKLHEEGKFTTFGLSNFQAWQVAELCTMARLTGCVQPTLYQAMYNAITRAIEPELIPCLRRFGIDLVVYNPLAGGFFSGKYKQGEKITEGRFTEGAKQGEMYRKRYIQDHYFQALDIIRPVADKNNLTLLEVALRWMVHHSQLNLATSKVKGNDGIIIGASSIEHLESNIKDLEKGPLPEEVVLALDEAWEAVKAKAPVYWHGEPRKDVRGEEQ